MSKNRKKTNKRKKSQSSFARSVIFKKKQHPKIAQFTNYNITFDALERTAFPDEVEAQFEELHNMIYDNPSEAIPRLKALKEKYPKICELYNWLSAALSANEQFEEAESIAKENYQKHPNYLFAKLNYAEFCFQQGKVDEVPIILDQKFDLKMHYPERDTFHITEVVGFFSITGRYYVETGKIGPAKTCFKLLQKIAPDHPATSQLLLKLAPSLFADYFREKGNNKIVKNE